MCLDLARFDKMIKNTEEVKKYAFLIGQDKKNNAQIFVPSSFR